jgi:hypothetical protein
VSQIALPLRIALVALLVIAAAWFTVLKPKSDSGSTAPPPVAPGVKGLANDVAKAKAASAQSDAANAAIQTATGGQSATPKPAAAATSTAASKPAGAAASKAASAKGSKAAAGDPSAPLLRELGKKHAVVLLFYSRQGSDDAFVRGQVRAVSRHHGHVAVKAAAIRTVGRYEAITQGVKVTESPTVLVIGPKKTAVPIVGYTTTAEINQAVADALHP